jgi:hypothetical protein
MCVWSLPKVFHTCGKNCGKSLGCVDRVRFEAEKSMSSPPSAQESLKYRGFLWGERAAK